LREERRLRVLEKRVLRRIYVPEKDEVTRKTQALDGRIILKRICMKWDGVHVLDLCG
jgi:hypothetical protein